MCIKICIISSLKITNVTEFVINNLNLKTILWYFQNVLLIFSEIAVQIKSQKNLKHFYRKKKVKMHKYRRIEFEKRLLKKYGKTKRNERMQLGFCFQYLAVS